MSSAADGPVPPALHELEAEIMEQLWRFGEANVRSVLDALNSTSERERAYTTVMTVMARLHGKGLLTRRREGKTDVYAPAMTREEYRRARAVGEVGALVDEFGDVALALFAQQVAELDPERRRQLRRLARKT